MKSDGAICHNPSTYLHVCRITLQQKNVLISAVFFEVNDALNCFGYREGEVLVTVLFDLLQRHHLNPHLMSISGKKLDINLIQVSGNFTHQDDMFGTSAAPVVFMISNFRRDFRSLSQEYAT